MAAVTSHVGCEVKLEVVREDPNACYHWGDLIVAPKPSEQTLAYLYLRWEAENVLPILFHSGVPALSWFLDTYSKINSLACWEKTDNGMACNGLTWFNSLQMIGEFKKSEAGIGFVRHLPAEKTLKHVQMAVDWAFRHMGVDVIHGATPVLNRAACLFMQKMGFQWTKVGSYFSFNGQLCDADVSWMTKDRWTTICPFRVEPKEG